MFHSAGVGRTGTLIALDILLQAINREQDIDIFGTVLNLRRDRKNMVQTEVNFLLNVLFIFVLLICNTSILF